jgi:hypothetical protein
VSARASSSARSRSRATPPASSLEGPFWEAPARHRGRGRPVGSGPDRAHRCGAGGSEPLLRDPGLRAALGAAADRLAGEPVGRHDGTRPQGPSADGGSSPRPAAARRGSAREASDPRRRRDVDAPRGGRAEGSEGSASPGARPPRTRCICRRRSCVRPRRAARLHAPLLGRPALRLDRARSSAPALRLDARLPRRFFGSPPSASCRAVPRRPPLGLDPRLLLGTTLGLEARPLFRGPTLRFDAGALLAPARRSALRLDRSLLGRPRRSASRERRRAPRPRAAFRLDPGRAPRARRRSASSRRRAWRRPPRPRSGRARAGGPSRGGWCAAGARCPRPRRPRSWRAPAAARSRRAPC